jgi:hypothetical protein
MQVLPEQHPPEQLLALQLPEHTPPVQAPAHDAHELPPMPQYICVLPVRQVVPSQQPFGQLAPSHLHTPPTQCWLAPHGPPVVPHTQVPLAVHVSAVIGHAAHAVPGAAHAAPEVVTQAPLAQQPPGHDVESHTQLPPLQRWPLAQANPAPQSQTPATQESAPMPHGWHRLPGVLHALVEVIVQTLPMQQPFGHEVASHTHAPPEQRCPPVHRVFPPHVHAPLTQPSARVESHAMQPEPGMPQAVTLGVGLHVGPEQHPPQLVVLQPEHAPPEQLWPPGHVWHVTPPAPQAFGSFPAWHVLLLSQQPDGHEVESQTQTPAKQRWPAAHGDPPPQLHAPF